MTRLPVILTLLIVTLLASVEASSRSDRKNPGSPSPADVAKADYLYLEALRSKSNENFDAAYELLSRAHRLNPADKEIGLELSNYLFMMATDPGDTLLLNDGMTMLRDYWMENPGDYHAGVRYGLLAIRLLSRPEAVEVWEKLHSAFPDKSEISFQLADVLSRAGGEEDRSRALAIFDSIEAVEGPSPQLSSNKIQLYLSRGDTTAVISEAERLFDAHPDKSELADFAGKIHAMFGDSDMALALFDRACQLDPTSGLAYYSKAEYYNSRGDSVGFDREVFNALRQPDLDVDTKLSILKGYIHEIYTDTVQQPRITHLFDTLVVQHPAAPEIRDDYARYLVVTKDYPGAAEQLEQAVGLEPDNPEGWEMLTSLYIQLDRLPQAADAARRSLHYFPENARQYLVLATIHSQEHRYDSCRVELENALKYTDPADIQALSSIYTTMGDNFFLQQQPDSAFHYYRRALQFNPDNTLALNNCAYHMAVEGKDLDDALALIERLMSIEDNNPTSLDTYAWVLFRRKDYAKAREIIDQTLELTPDEDLTADVLEHAGDIYFMDGDPDRAVEFWKQALKFDPDNKLLQRKVTNRAYYFK